MSVYCVQYEISAAARGFLPFNDLSHATFFPALSVSLCHTLFTSHSLQTFAEELVRMPGSFLCYTPVPEPPTIAPLPATLNGFVTFGSFNNLAKITPAVLSLWARILHR